MVPRDAPRLQQRFGQKPVRLVESTGIGVDAYSLIEQGRVIGLVDANSLDRREIFEEAALVDGVRVLRHAVNLGKGAALKTAFNHALCEWPGADGCAEVDRRYEVPA